MDKLRTGIEMTISGTLEKTLVCALTLLTATAALQAKDAVAQRSYCVSLRDGSRVIGRLNHQELPLKTLLGDVRIPLARMKSCTRSTSGLLFVMDNGDRVTGTLKQDSLSITSLVGRHPINERTVVRIDPGATIDDKSYRAVAGPDKGPDGKDFKGAQIIAFLADGSTIVGRSNLTHIKFRTPYAKMMIESKNVRRVVIGKNNEIGVILLANGDKLTGAVDLGSLALQSSFGTVIPKLSHLRKVYVRTPGRMTEKMQDALILSYKFDDPKDLFADSSSTKHKGRGHGGVMSAEGRQGKSRRGCQLDGRGSYIDISAIRGSLPRERHSIAVWVRPDASTLKNGTIFSNWHRELVHFRDGKLALQVPVAPRANAGQGSAAYILKTKKDISAGIWYHVVYTFAAGKEAILYVNGEKVDSAKEKMGQGIAWYEKNFEIGRIKDFTPARCYYKGDLDDLHIFDRALTSEEVQILFGSL